VSYFSSLIKVGREGEFGDAWEKRAREYVVQIGGGLQHGSASVDSCSSIASRSRDVRRR
jgi:hypothetical protein